MKTLTRPLLFAFPVLALSAVSQGAVVYSGFGNSTVGAVAPQGWTRVGTPAGGAGSEITAAGFFQMTAPGTGANTLSLYNSGSAISRTAGEGFRITAVFTTTSGTGQFENTAFFFMANADGTTGPRLNFNMGTGGTGLLEFASTATQTNGTLAGYTALEAANAVYTLTLTGIFQANGSLALDAFVSNSVNGNTASSTATLAAPAGANNFFGLRTAAGGTGTGHGASATYQSYVLETIPEPSAVMLVAGGAVLGLVRRRRK